MPHKLEATQIPPTSNTTHETMSSFKTSQQQQRPSVHRSPTSSTLAALQIQHFREQGLPYASSHFDATKKFSLQEWLSRLDTIIEESSAAMGRRHSLPPTHKRSASEGVKTLEERSHKRQRRRNSFVIHRDAQGHNVSLLNPSFQDLLRQEDAEADCNQTEKAQG